ncbi:hypothetical protein IscW_ISCW008517 [Ixodes scapularis]|uniref:Uncharacterized protein n=1 Tax=Ixodes scapularis TaxID=6945 RepID=B7Q027_IXOSC|nr:hypothetical protein IscW_ISCW008517 [Ixodes scapularis]|eukprot:XP_002406753.1 hypothetical protein IscW_ISCW008517 [Ixodes scapularis]
MAAAAAAAEFGAAVGCSREERDTGRQVPLADRERAGGGAEELAECRRRPNGPKEPPSRARESGPEEREDRATTSPTELNANAGFVFDAQK